MHPALRQYVGRPSPRVARYVAVGALTGFASVALALAIVRLVEVHRGNERQEAIERRHQQRAAYAASARDLVLARTLARDFAMHGWPSWVVANPDRDCPANLAELERYVGDGTTIDPWGNPFRFRCDGGHFRVTSDGPDRTPSTSDDIRSVR
jgi:hypothetical protein